MSTVLMFVGAIAIAVLAYALGAMVLANPVLPIVFAIVAPIVAVVIWTRSTA